MRTIGDSRLVLTRRLYSSLVKRSLMMQLRLLRLEKKKEREASIIINHLKFMFTSKFSKLES